ncbi:Uncharacterised protein [Vibrio cholerae]|nr:Uncharacterised protein [Vibrio cholerae]
MITGLVGRERPSFKRAHHKVVARARFWIRVNIQRPCTALRFCHTIVEHAAPIVFGHKGIKLSDGRKIRVQQSLVLGEGFRHIDDLAVTVFLTDDDWTFELIQRRILIWRETCQR